MLNCEFMNFVFKLMFKGSFNLPLKFLKIMSSFGIMQALIIMENNFSDMQMGSNSLQRLPF